MPDLPKKYCVVFQFQGRYAAAAFLSLLEELDVPWTRNTEFPVDSQNIRLAVSPEGAEVVSFKADQGYRIGERYRHGTVRRVVNVQTIEYEPFV